MATSFWMKTSNAVMGSLLRSPLHALLSGQMMIITVTGRKSGRRTSTPVEYRREGNTLTVFSRRQRNWWKNVQGGAPVQVLLQGQTLNGRAEVDPRIGPELTAEFQKRYPRMSEAQVNRIAPDLVLVRIALTP